MDIFKKDEPTCGICSGPHTTGDHVRWQAKVDAGETIDAPGEPQP